MGRRPMGSYGLYCVTLAAKGKGPWGPFGITRYGKCIVGLNLEPGLVFAQSEQPAMSISRGAWKEPRRVLHAVTTLPPR
jgi:hypothetical protein